MLSALCQAQSKPAMTAGCEQYTLRNGLPQSQVYALAQDEAGYLWVGTHGGGLSRFDGNRFENFGIDDGLKGLRIQSILILPGDSLAVGTTHGLFTGKERFVEATTFEGKSLSINNLCHFNDQIYAATPNGVWIYDGTSLSELENHENNGQEVFDLEVFNGSLYMGGIGGLYRLQGERWIASEYKPRSELVNALENVGDSILAIGYYGSGVDLWDGKEKIQLRELRNEIVHSLWNNGDELWIATLSNGIISYNLKTDQYQTLSEANGLISNDIRCMMKDRWGQTWLGTSGSGLGKLIEGPFQHIDKFSGLPDNEIYSIAEIAPNLFALGCGNEGLVRLDLSAGLNISQDEVLSTGKVKALYYDSTERLWAGTEGNGLFLYDADTTMHLTRSDGLTSNWIKHITEDTNEKIFLSTYGGGICTIEQQSLDPLDFLIKRFTTPAGFPGDRYSFTIPFSDGKLIVGSIGEGLILADPKSGYTSITTCDSETFESVLCHVDVDSTYFFGVPELGLVRGQWQDNELILSKVDDTFQPTGSNIYSLSYREGELWVGTEKGVSLLALDEDKKVISSSHFAQEDGFTGIECCTRSAVRSAENIWVGTIDGLTKIGPISQENAPLAPPTIQLSEMRLFYKPLLLDSVLKGKKPIVFTHNQHDLSFRTEAVHLAQSKRIVYHWKLAGKDSLWTSSIGASNVSYSNLPPGDYAFESYAQVGNAKGKTLNIPFKILAPWWTAWWVWPLAIAIGVLLLALIFWSIISRIKSKAKVKEERLIMERDLLDLERKAMQLQMNPHFLFNALNSIQGMVATRDVPTARRTLAKFARLMRRVLNNSRKELIGLDEELEAIEEYLALEQAMHEQSFDFEIQTDLNAQAWAIPPMIVQPFVENAIIHGVLPKANGGTILIKSEEHDDHISVYIEDNGVGRNAPKDTSEKRHESIALEVTEKRLAQWDGKRRGFEIIDLEINGVATGTRVILRIPKLENLDF